MQDCPCTDRTCGGVRTRGGFWTRVSAIFKGFVELPATEIVAREDDGAELLLAPELKGARLPFRSPKVKEEGTSANAELQTSPLLAPAVETKPLLELPPVGRPGDDTADRLPSDLGVVEPCHRGRGLKIPTFPRFDWTLLTGITLS